MSNESDMYFQNAKRDIDHSYWNALLTLNGILISVFTAFSFFSDNLKILMFIIVVMSIYACWLIIKNFKISQIAYDKIGFSSKDEKFTKMSEKELDNFINEKLQDATVLRVKVVNNEKIVHRLFYIQMFFIIILLLQNIIKDYWCSC